VLTEKQLKEIEERASKATPGPWTLDINYLVGFPPKTRPTGESIMLLEETCRAGSAEADDANMEFIAHAREDVPALLEEVKRLQAKQAIWENCIHTNGTSTEQQKHEVARLQEALIEERAAKIETQRSLAFAEGYDYTLPNPLPTAQDQARTELQSEGRIPK